MTIHESYFPKIPDFRTLEPRNQAYWKALNLYKFNPENPNTYRIDSPPPSISGALHMGHAKSYTPTDILARVKRLQGFNVHFPLGFDDNGLPTEKYAAKLLGISINDLRDPKYGTDMAIIIRNARKQYKGVFDRLGFSFDSKLWYSTFSNDCRQIAQESFLDLYEKGLLYRSKEPTNWCPECQTGVAEAELNTITSKVQLVYIPFSTGNKKIEIATTRPELLGAIQAVYVNPNDQRYQHMIGQKVKVPLYDLNVEIKAHEKIQEGFGTGAMMLCTFGDKNDVDIWKEEHGLESRIIIDDVGLSTLPGYEGLSMAQLRNRVMDELSIHGLISQIENTVQEKKVHERDNVEIEYLLKDQWMIDVLSMKDELIDAGRKIKWHPEYMIHRYEDWVNNLKWNWNISRQRPFGVPFPVWYKKGTGEIYVADHKDLPVDPTQFTPGGFHEGELIPEKDVMDTWMTSSLTPYINSRRLQDLQVAPNDLRTQAHDIITSWTMYTIYKSIVHSGKIPWKDIMISGHGMDKYGKKMSKSEGNLIEPDTVISGVPGDKDKPPYAADAIRLWAAKGKLGTDQNFDYKAVKDERSFLLKYWNIARYTFGELSDYRSLMFENSAHLLDRWITAKRDLLIGTINQAVDNFDQLSYKTAIQKFVRRDLSDYYIESAKSRLTVGDSSSVQAASTLYNIVKDVTMLLNPLVPHISEEIYQYLQKPWENHENVDKLGWPEQNPEIDKDALKLGDTLFEAIGKIREYKREHEMRNKDPLPNLSVTIPVSNGSKNDLENMVSTISNWMNIGELDLRTVAGEQNHEIVVH